MSRIKLNVGGTHYEVSESLLDQYPNSMLRRISSDTWNDTAAANAEPNEIFIDRNGTRFAYVLDYMRDARVELPLSVPRAQLIADLEYLGIEFAPERITLSVADPKDLFHGLASYKEFFTSKSVDIAKRYREVAAEKLANDIATAYFSQLVHATPVAKTTGNQQSSDQVSTAGLGFATTHLAVRYPEGHGIDVHDEKFSISELKEHLKSVGLKAHELSYPISFAEKGKVVVEIGLI